MWPTLRPGRLPDGFRMDVDAAPTAGSHESRLDLTCRIGTAIRQARVKPQDAILPPLTFIVFIFVLGMRVSSWVLKTHEFSV